jgi:hypothetical protein
LGDVPLNEPRVISALRSHILEGLGELGT